MSKGVKCPFVANDKSFKPADGRPLAYHFVGVERFIGIIG